jgi:hypothetical protein
MYKGEYRLQPAQVPREMGFMNPAAPPFVPPENLRRSHAPENLPNRLAGLFAEFDDDLDDSFEVSLD